MGIKSMNTYSSLWICAIVLCHRNRPSSLVWGATGYRRYFGLLVPSELPYLGHSLPSGYIISSAEDITHYLIAQLNEGRYNNISILSPSGIAQLHEPAVQAGNVHYGMGWVIGEVNGVSTIWHHGSTANFHSTMLLQPEAKRGIVILTNVGLFELWHVGSSEVIAEGIARLLNGQSPSDYGPTIISRYLIADIIIGLVTVLILVFIMLLPRWRKKLIVHPPKTILSIVRRVIFPIVIEITWPLTVLIAFPTITNVPSWSYWLLYKPDFALWLIILVFVMLASGCIRIWLSLPVFKSFVRTFGALRVILAMLGAENMFILLFLAVMFLSTCPANFTIGIFVLVLIFEAIAIPY